MSTRRQQPLFYVNKFTKMPVLTLLLLLPLLAHGQWACLDAGQAWALVGADASDGGCGGEAYVFRKAGDMAMSAVVQYPRAIRFKLLAEEGATSGSLVVEVSTNASHTDFATVELYSAADFSTSGCGPSPYLEAGLHLYPGERVVRIRDSRGSGGHVLTVSEVMVTCFFYDECRDETYGCAKPEKLKGICADIYKDDEVVDPWNFSRFESERKIHVAACAVHFRDSEELIIEKIQSMWLKLEDSLTCDCDNFNVPGGSILKYAVAMQNTAFIVQAAKVWRVNLNRVDPSDQRTVLDYVEDEMRKTEDPSYEKVLKGYREIFIESGAKRKSEL